MRRQISAETWEQIKTAFASGIGLREIARNMGIPEGTVLARASREQWTPRIEAAKSLAKPAESAIVPACDAAALTMQERAQNGTSSEWRASQTRFCRTWNQWSRPKFSTARATWSDSITSRGATTDWRINRLQGAANQSWRFLTNQAVIVESKPV